MVLPYGPAGPTSADEGPGGIPQALGLVVALLGAGGLAACMTLLYRGMAVIMETEGGFVAYGGPYEIAHPAPEWVWIIPLSILSMFVFGGVSLWASFRGWGANLLAVAWSALFISLGWNFLRLGIFDRPEGLQGAWGWILPGVVFWIMGFAPLLRPLGAIYAKRRYGWESTPGARIGMFGISLTPTQPAYVIAQAVGALAGVAAALALFRTIAG